MTTPVTNPAGQIALKYNPGGRALAQNTPSGNGYVFVVRANISMAWVDPKDTGNLLSRRKGG